MYGGLSGEGPANDAVINSASKPEGSGDQSHQLNPAQFKGLTGGGGGGAGGAAAGGAEAGGAAAAGGGLSELAVLAV